MYFLFLVQTFVDVIKSKSLNFLKFEYLKRGGSRTAATPKMERFVITDFWKPLTIIAKRSILDVAAALDPLLFKISGYLKISTLLVPIPRTKREINWNIYFHFSLWCLKRFYESFKSLQKTFRGTAKRCEKKVNFYLKKTFWNALGGKT